MPTRDKQRNGKSEDPSTDEELVDEALDETFPASDPPGSTSTTDDDDALSGDDHKRDSG
ncbi:hypothetical protein [Algiphilus sp.]|uniref:hypothetical protein n=1 Tax=Algiphilus sp. TaxID=1872431 RepID=UPI0025C1FB41|nr:hypothetical protein [Algiphilus sp.]MCK5769075.1 hypothetical protein [Algiphilus sp.]